MSQDAWHRAKDQNSIRSTWAEKTSKNCWNLQEIKNWYFSSVFWRFLSPGWSDWVLVFCSVSGILRHKFRVPTKGTLKTKIFWPTKGAWLSSEVRSQTKMDKNYFFKAVSPIPMYRHMEFYSKFGRLWDFCFFSTPYCTSWSFVIQVCCCLDHWYIGEPECPTGKQRFHGSKTYLHSSS